jgi:endonuclease-8
MPEGDSIRRVAARVRPLLAGKALTFARARGVEQRALVGQTVVSVEPVGKHLLITTDADVEIRTHLGMNGRWYRIAPDAPPPPSATLALATSDDVLVCTGMTVEILARRDPRRGAAVARLGPDILGDSFDATAAVARARSLPPTTRVSDVLVDQRVSAGIGNIYRCEALFLEGVSPTATLAQVDDATLTALLARARELMQQSVAGTRSPRSVYRQVGRPCPRCRTPVRSALDPAARRIYYCPRCQRGV